MREATPTEDQRLSALRRNSIWPLMWGSWAIMLSTDLQAWITVPWSRPPKASPMSWRECLAMSVRVRYIAIWRGMAMLLGRRLLVMSLWRI